MNNPTAGLFQQHLEEVGLHPQYKKGYCDALLDVYLIVKFANQVEPVFSDVKGSLAP